MKFAIDVKDLSKTHVDGPHLKNINFSLARGEVGCIVGGIGSGKTSLMNCILNLSVFSGAVTLAPTSGISFEIRGRGSKDPHAMYKNIGFVSQNSSLWETMTVLENVAVIPQLVEGKSKDEANELAKSVLNDVGIGNELYDAFPNSKTIGGSHRLSGGERRLVALARALIKRPALLLVDEIEANLHPDVLKSVLDIIKQRYVDSPDTATQTALIVTHNTEIVSQLASRLFVMDSGQLMDKSDRIKLPWNENWASQAKSSPLPYSSSDICLAYAARISRRCSEVRDVDADLWLDTCDIFCELLSQLEKDEDHLVLFAKIGELDSSGNQNVPKIHAISASDGFLLNGRDRTKLIGYTSGHDQDPPESTRPYLVPDNSVGKENAIDGIELHGNGLIPWVLDQKMREPAMAYRYRYSEQHHEKPGIFRFSKKSHWQTQKTATPYFEFSRMTSQVYLFDVVANGELVGLISVDTTSDQVWDQKIVETLRLMAEVISQVFVATSPNSEKQNEN